MNEAKRLATFTLVALGLLALAGPAAADIYTFTAILDGSSAVPPSPATGTAALVVDDEITGPERIMVQAEYFDLSGPVVQVAFYNGEPGNGGTYLQDIGTDNPLNVPLPFVNLLVAAQLSQALYADNLYYLVVTGAAKDYPDGELVGHFELSNTVGDESSAWGGVKALYR